MSINFFITIYLIFILIIGFVSINMDGFKNRKTPNNYFLNILINTGYSIVLLIVINKFYFFKGKSYSFNVLKIIGLFIVFDALFYWSHRIMHRVPFLRRMLF